MVFLLPIPIIMGAGEKDPSLLLISNDGLIWIYGFLLIVGFLVSHYWKVRALYTFEGQKGKSLHWTEVATLSGGGHRLAEATLASLFEKSLLHITDQDLAITRDNSKIANVGVMEKKVLALFKNEDQVPKKSVVD